MSYKRDLCGPEGLLIDGGCGNGRDLACHSQLYALFDISVGSFPAHGLDLSVDKGLHVDAAQIDHVQDSRAEVAFLRIRNDPDGQRSLFDGDSLLHHGPVSDQNNVRPLMDGRI